MPVLSLEDHELIRQLTAAGFSQQEARSVTRAVVAARDLDPSRPRSKAARHRRFLEIEARISAVRVELKGDMARVKRDLTIRFGAMIAVTTVVLLAVLDQLP
jgi:tetrahydromethanopterin S-methyltransferase subunit G